MPRGFNPWSNHEWVMETQFALQPFSIDTSQSLISSWRASKRR